MRKTWRPPQTDATDIIIDRLLDRSSIEPINGYPRHTYKALQKAQIDFLSSEWLSVKADRELINKKIKDIIEESKRGG
jgi:hypothetical protein